MNTKCHNASWTWNLCLHSDFTLKKHPKISPSRHTIPFLLLWIPGLCWKPPNIIFPFWVISEANSAISIPLQAVIFPILQPVNIWTGRKMGCFKGQIIFYLFSPILAYARPRLLLKCLQFPLLLFFLVEFKLQWQRPRDLNHSSLYSW